MSTRVITAHVPVDLAEKVDEFAGQLERSRGWIVKEALRDWIDLAEERHRMMLEGLADIDAGRMVDHAEVVAWAQSLDPGEDPA